MFMMNQSLLLGLVAIKVVAAARTYLQLYNEREESETFDLLETQTVNYCAIMNLKGLW